MLDVTAYQVVDAQERDHPCRCNSPRWTVVTTHPQAERWAAANLARRGYETYLPLCRVLRRDRATPTIRHQVKVPAFSGYLFVQHTPGSSWRPIYETPGVRSMLRNGCQLQYAPDHAIAAIHSALHAADALAATPQRWAPGTPCSLSQGPLASMPAVILRCTNDSATIACLFLGQLREITVPVDALTHRDNV